MRASRLQPLAVAAATLLSMHAAQAIGLGRPQTLSSLGQALHLSFPLSLGTGESLSPECVQVEVLAGDVRLPQGSVLIELEGPTQTSVRALRLRSTQQISEPIVSVSLQLGCPTRLVRQFTAFIDPPDVDAAPAAPLPPVAVVRQYSPQMQAALATSEARPAQLLAPLPQAPTEVARMPAVEPLRSAGQVAQAPTRGASTADAPRESGEGRTASTAAAVAASRPASKRVDADKPASQKPSTEQPPADKAGAKTAAKTAEKSADKPADKPAAKVQTKAEEDKPRVSSAPPAAARLRLEPAEVLNDKAEAERAAAAASAASAAASAAALPDAEAERLARLEQGLKLLQVEQREAQGQISSLRRQLDQARAERYMNPLVYGLGAAVLLLAGLLAVLWRSRQRERLMLESQWWREVRDEVQSSPAPSPAVVAQAAGADVASAPVEVPAAAAPAAVPGTPPAAAGAALAGLHVEFPHEAPAAVPTLALSQALSSEQLAPAQMPRFEATAPAPAEEALDEAAVPARPAPEPALEPISFQFIDPAQASSVAPRAAAPRINVEELIDLEQQTEFFVVLGQDEAAIDLLSRRIADDARDVALPYLKLLRIYQRRGQRFEFETIAREFAERFGRPIPGWAETLEQGAGLEAQPDVLKLVQRRWGDSAATMSLLQALLVGHAEQGTVPEVLPPGAYDLGAQADLLMLYGVARDISEHEVRGDDIDLFLPLDSAARSPATGMMATMVWQRPGQAPLASPSPLEVDISLDEPEPPRSAQ